MRNVVSLVLGGGKGTRLYPLTQFRSKPAVPLAGKYRLIDIPISNCINSGIYRIYLLTQFNSVSLHRHIRQTYRFDRFTGGFVEILAAQQTLEGAAWYQGTADAVRKNLRYIQERDIDYVFILSGDQLYRMNYVDMLETHRTSNADVTIAAVPVASSAASSFGIMRLEDSGRVAGFLEKPQTEDELKLVRTAPSWIDERGIKSNGRDCLASMGIYLFNRDTLVKLLSKSDYQDFGKEVFTMALRTHHAHVHLFDGYWEDIGTIRAFYEANLALVSSNPPFDFSSEHAPIYSRARYLPPTRIDGAKISNSLIADGCVIEKGAVIENSVIGLRCRIGKNVTVKDSILMGADYYEAPSALAPGQPGVGIGEGSEIRGAIIDKNCHIGSRVRVDARSARQDDADYDQVVMQDGVAVVRRSSTLPDEWTLKG
jgi:glucose-1-phosphate adenylyltransferase